MAVITTDEAKVFLQISDTSKDSLIDALIPEIEGDIKEYCVYSFLDSEGNEDWPSGIKIVAARMIGEMIDGISNSGMKSETQGGYSYTRDMSANGYSQSVMKSLDKWKRARTGFAQPTQQYRDRRYMSEGQLAKGQSSRGIPGEPLYTDDSE